MREDKECVSDLFAGLGVWIARTGWHFTRLGGGTILTFNNYFI